MRTIKNIFVHCTATPQHTTIEQLQAAFRRRGWSAPGYHYVICPTGRIVKLLDEAGFDGYWVLEQDIMLDEEPPADGGPVASAAKSYKALAALAS